MLRLLINSLAREFYQRHAGFFLIGFYVLFGVVEPSQLLSYHEALLIAGISSPMGMAIVFVSWGLYSLKVHFFIRQELASARYNFISEMGKLDKSTHLKLWMALLCTIILPIIIYAIVLIGLCVYHQFFISLACILIVFFSIAFGLSFLYYQSSTYGFLKQDRQPVNLLGKIKRPFLSWPLHYLLSEQTVMLIMCKVMSLIFFKGILWVFADVGNDTRVLLVALLASVLSHAVLVFTLLKFEVTFLNFSKSMPISTYQRLVNWLFTFAVILFPEWILLMISSQWSLYPIMNGFLFSIAGLLLLLTSLYIVKLNMDLYLRWLLFFFFISMWSILAHYYLAYSFVLLISCALYYLNNFKKADLAA